jgi:hypothetical protein
LPTAKLSAYMMLTVDFSRWESLEEKPIQGQWKYFERKSS